MHSVSVPRWRQLDVKVTNEKQFKWWDNVSTKDQTFCLFESQDCSNWFWSSGSQTYCNKTQITQRGQRIREMYLYKAFCFEQISYPLNFKSILHINSLWRNFYTYYLLHSLWVSKSIPFIKMSMFSLLFYSDIWLKIGHHLIYI